jgi:hypothetical protein
VKLTEEEKAKKQELQELHGDDCAFFVTPIGLVALAVPDPPAKGRHPFWDLFVGMRSEGADTAALFAEFAVKCSVYPEREKLVPHLTKKPALGVLLGKKARDLCGESEPLNPELEGAEAEEVERLKKEHGDVAWYRPGGKLVVLMEPKPIVYRQFFNEASAGGTDSRPEELFPDFVLDCVACPSRESVAAILQRKPALARQMALTGQELAGGGVEELGKD